MAENLNTAPNRPPYRRGVGLVIFNAQGLVFCAERRDAPEHWQMPQGGLKPGETPQQAALREMLEETGTSKAEILAEMPEWLRYDFPDYVQREAFRGKYRGQEQKWLALKFTGQDLDIALTNPHQDEPPEFVQWRWVALEDLPALIVPFKRDVYAAVAAEFAPWPARLRGAKNASGA